MPATRACVPEHGLLLSQAVDVVFKYRGRAVTTADVRFMRELIYSQPNLSRRRLSEHVCKAWGWRQSNGQLRDMVCRGLMLALHRQGHIELPPVRQRSDNPVARHRKPTAMLSEWEPVQGKLAELGALEFHQVRRSPEEPLFNGLMQTHHYLGYTRPVGEHLKYVVYARGTPVALLAWSSAPRHLGPRDRFIGWSPEVRRRNIRMVAYNTRFLILPWVQVEHLASHVLGRMAKVLPVDWARVYGHPIYFLETFIEPERFRGTCYRAANWIVLGQTTGRGKDAPTKAATRTKKNLLGYPLTPRFRELMSRVA